MAELPLTDDYRALFLEDRPLLDLRSPGEFAHGSFPGAHGLPLMSNEERARVGTCYKRQGQAAAIALGHRLVSGQVREQRMAAWLDWARRHPRGVLYCWRGGLRSQTVQAWLAEAGVVVPRVVGGYKALRRFLIDELERSLGRAPFGRAPLGRAPLVLVAGATGCGKTRVIEALDHAIDLEGLAHHRGSSFGQLPEPQPSQIDFENALSIAFLRRLAGEGAAVAGSTSSHHGASTEAPTGPGPVFLEDEGRLIGRVALPDTLSQCMLRAPLVVVEESLESRVQVVLEDYVLDLGQRFCEQAGPDVGRERHRERLLDGLDRIRKRLGGARHQAIRALMEAAFEGQFARGDVEPHREWIRALLTDYYDPMYRYQLSQRQGDVLFTGSRAAVIDFAPGVLRLLKLPERRRDLLLVGGGHTHALALRMLAMRPIEGLQITLVSPATHTPYSGMLPGLIAGHYRFEETHIDLARLCQWAGVRFVAAEATGIDADGHRLSLAGRPALAYDLLSVDIGSQPELDSVPGAREFAIPVKPVAGLWSRWQALEAELTRSGTALRQLVVVGGGAGSVELVLAMAHRLRGRPVRFSLVCGAPELLPGYHPGARRAVLAALADAGIELLRGQRVVSVEQDRLQLEGGDSVSWDALFWCTAAAATPWVAASGLATDARGFLAVDDTLRVRGQEALFAAGDIATQLSDPRPKAGVFAVRQAPVLAYNLRAHLLGRPLRAYRPQRRFLSLLSLGERKAVADRGLFFASGAWVWRWKDRIDRRFMDRFADLPARMDRPATARLPDAPPRRQAFCGGCGAKVGGDALGKALVRLRRDFPGHCPATPDDAVAMPLPAGGRQVQSLDILRGLVEDPWLMGRLAALHALSDLYACGARPLSALAALTLPFASPALQERELEQLLAGALREFAAADCQLLGGHSLQGAELALGFAVQGEPMDPAGRLLPKRGLSPGDRLVLGKPLGTGTLFAAHMQARADGRDIAAAIDSMLQSSARAAEIALAHAVTAATDVTGFGLAGHLREMLAPGQAARLTLSALPVLPGALGCLEKGILSTAQADNESLARLPAGPDSPRRRLLCDPQTCGGLLMGVPAQAVEALLDELRGAGYRQAAVIGEVLADEGGWVLEE